MRCYIIFTWSRFIIYMVSSFTWYTGIFCPYYFRKITFKDIVLPENLKNFAETLNIVWPAGFMELAFSYSRDPWHLVAPGRHQVPSGFVVRRESKGPGLVEHWSTESVSPICGIFLFYINFFKYIFLQTIFNSIYI